VEDEIAMNKEPFDGFDATSVLESAIRKYWESEIARGVENVPYDDLDPVRRHEVRQHVMIVAPHIISALKEHLILRSPVAVPDMIPVYFFGEGTA
jgi:hypothetical protein